MSIRSDEIIVAHGPWVETWDDCFFAAAWSGPVDDARPDQAVACCGTGARLGSEACIFFTSSNLLDPIFLKRVPHGVVISNSLTHLLVDTGDEPVPDYFMYNELLCVFSGQGIHRKQRSIPTRCGEAEVYECCNLEFGRDLQLVRREKPAPPPPRDYNQYITLLETHLSSVMNNACDASRSVKYSAMANNSRGYDSNCIAALAKKQGVFESITFAENVPGEPSPDDGTPLAEVLGLKVHKHPKRGYSSTEKFPEAEFLACPPGWESPLGATENTLAGRLNLNGHYGGTIFKANKGRTILPDLTGHIIGTPGSASWEYCLRIGCLNFALFYTGWQHAKRLYDISTSAEMRPWSIGGDYDRPIPRRYLEEAGVPGDLFGWSEYAGAAEVLVGADRFWPATWADVENFVSEHSNNFRIPVKAPERYLYHWGFYRTRERYDRAYAGTGLMPRAV